MTKVRKIENPAANGDIVAVVINHSSTNVSMKVKRHATYHLAKVETAKQNGEVSSVRFAGSALRTHIDYTMWVMTISGLNQEPARRLFAQIDKPDGENSDHHWTSADDIRSAILAA